MNQGQQADQVTILVADDEEAVRELLRLVFTKDGFRVHAVATGADAVQVARDVRPALIIMDITMPNMDDYEATSQIKQDPALRETPVIFLTGKTAQEDAGRSFAKGGLTFVRKPFSSQQIRDLVNLTLQSLGGKREAR
jgi:CheY-like chemotaxis protein